jgi:hypothetical protein
MAKAKYNTKKTSALNKRSNRRKGTVVRQLRVINLHSLCGVAPGPLDVLLIVTRGRRTRLFYKVYNALLGFDATAQGYLIEAVALYHSGESVTYTDFPHVNAVLRRLYKAIDAALAAGE